MYKYDRRAFSLAIYSLLKFADITSHPYPPAITATLTLLKSLSRLDGYTVSNFGISQPTDEVYDLPLLHNRLDRLVLLLDTGSTAAVRQTAAQQLGEIQKQHPSELYNLLSRVRWRFV